MATPQRLASFCQIVQRWRGAHHGQKDSRTTVTAPVWFPGGAQAVTWRGVRIRSNLDPRSKSASTGLSATVKGALRQGRLDAAIEPVQRLHDVANKKFGLGSPGERLRFLRVLV
jgi:hypothetical protein